MLAIHSAFMLQPNQTTALKEVPAGKLTNNIHEAIKW